jgi:hypothetical protein
MTLPPVPVLRRLGVWLLLAVALALPAAARAQAAPADAVAAFTGVSAQLLGLEFDAAERDALRRLLDGYWQRQDRRGIDSVLSTREFAAQLATRDPALRAVAMRMSRPDALLNLQADAERGDAVSQWLLQRYAQRHPALAPARPGGLPLTRDSIDGQLDLAHFMATEIHRQPARAPSVAEREAAYRAAAARHAQLSAEEQVQLARAPGEAARLRHGWARAQPMDRLIGRAELGGRLTPAEQAEVQRFMAGLQQQLHGMVQQHQQSMLGGALAAMRQNSETIMGRGTVWNPATNRWEQQGGIVTEFNGTVRVP